MLFQKKRKFKTLFSLMLIFTLLFSGTTVFADDTKNDEEDINNIIPVYNIEKYDGDKTDFLSFNTVEEMEEFLITFQKSLNTPVESISSPVSRALCCDENKRMSYQTTHIMEPKYPSAWKFVLTTDYYKKCTNNYPTLPHHKNCAIYTATYPTISTSGLTAGVFFENDSINSRIYSDKKGFETFARGTVHIGVDIGGIGNWVTFPYSISHKLPIF